MPSEITSQNINEILKALGRQYKRLVRNAPRAEIVLVGGAAILCQYDFRQMSVDINAIIIAESALGDAAITVGDQFGLEHNWLNAGFVNTASYSPKLRLYSKYYRTFSNILEVRIASPVCLLAMKLMSFRQYKHDLSDIVGIIMGEQKKGNIISKADIIKMFSDLYGQEKFTHERLLILDRIYETDNLNGLYEEITTEEESAGILLRSFDRKYPGMMTQNNLDDVLGQLRQRTSGKK